MHVQRSETAPEVCHFSEVLDDPIFSSYASILDPACVVKVKGQVTPLASFHPWTRRADTHCIFSIYITLCLLSCKLHPCERRSPGCAKPREDERQQRYQNALGMHLVFAPRPHPTTFAASRSVPIPQIGLCTSYFDPSKAVPGTQGA